jgi:hypothetical protein
MATKKPGIAALVDQSMAGRNLASTPAAPEGAGRERFKPTPKQQVMIRLDDGDYLTLQRIAERKGTKAATLIRQAVKDIIRTEGGACPVSKDPRKSPVFTIGRR